MKSGRSAFHFLKHLFGGTPSRPLAQPSKSAGAWTVPFIVINGAPLTQKELEDRVAKWTTPVEPSPTVGPPLKLIGYWAPAPQWREERVCSQAPRWPDVRRAVRPNWRVAERELLVAYLRKGHRCRGYLGFSACRFDCPETNGALGCRELTDGEWVWPEGLPHYVERHDVMLPEEFVASASARQWVVPAVESLRKRSVDYTFWLAWAANLPDVPDSPPSR